MRSAVLAAGICFLLTALAACAPHSTRPPCPAGQVCLEIGNGTEPATLDPALSATTWENAIIGDLMIGLTQNDAQANTVPGIATSWQTSPDGLVWTFHLRDAQWSDGSAVEAGDFVLTMQRVVDPKVASEEALLLYVLKNGEAINGGKLPVSALGARALDAHTLQLTLDHPAPYLLQLAKHSVMMPTPRRAFARWGEHWAQPGHYVSDGPYELVAWKQNDHVELARNPRFYEAGSICADRVNYYPMDDKISGERRVRRGELDINGQNGVTMSRVSYLRQPDQIPAYVHTHTAVASEYLQFNQRIPALNDRRVRQALTMAIDRDFIVGPLRRGGEPIANTLVPPGVAGAAPAEPPYWAAWPLARRQTKARALLAEAGFGPGHPLKLTLLKRSIADPQLHLLVVQSNWQAVGVGAIIAANDGAVAYAAMRSGDFQVGNPGWVADYNDPMSFMALLRSDNEGFNYGDYKNPAYDSLLNQANHEIDGARRAAILAKAEHIMLEDAPIAPLWFWLNTNLVNPRVTGWADNVTDQHPSRFVCFAGVKPGPR